MIPVRGFEGKTVAVFGLARTGLAAARALIAGGAEGALWDEKPAAREAAAAEGRPLPARPAEPPMLAGVEELALWDEKPAAREAAAAEGLPLVDLTTADWSR